MWYGLIKSIIRKGNSEPCRHFRLTQRKKEKQQAISSEFFFEDINHAADGGLYAELIQNRAFEFDPIDNKKYHALYAWMLVS